MIEKIAQAPLKNLLVDVYNLSKGPLKQAILSCLTDVAKDLRKRYENEISHVKTIWQIDKPVDVSEFYYPTRIDFGGKHKPVDNISELCIDNRAVIIEGIAGQGKSIFMRYICKNCIIKGNTIPVFVQLRHISANQNLNSLIKHSLESMGIVDDPLVIEYLLRNDKLCFILDGFDEINEEYRSETISYIEKNLHKYNKIKVVISSRPNSEIQHSYLFSVYQIKPLNPTDREKLIDKLVDNKEIKKSIITSIKDKPKISGILTTPLLVTLLVITYKSESEIPEHLSDFYKSLFNTLIKRHDKTKPGFVREKRSKFGNVEFEKIFENLCFIALNRYKISMSERDFYEFSDEAIRSQNYEKASPSDLVEDITKITCLVLLDGDKYYFLHKSIPEYFAAQKISEEKNQILVDSFYQQMLNIEIPENWYQTLFFLSEIDEYNYNNKLLIPYLSKIFNVQGKNLPKTPEKISKDDFVKMVGNGAELDLKKYGRKYNVHLLKDSKNWAVNTSLSRSIEESIYIFINTYASELMIDGMITAHSRSKNFKHILEYSSSWPSFLSFINSQSSPLRGEYNKLLKIEKRMNDRVKSMKPMLIINS